MRPRQGTWAGYPPRRLGMGTHGTGTRQAAPAEGSRVCGIGWHRVAYPQGGIPSPPPV